MTQPPDDPNRPDPNVPGESPNNPQQPYPQGGPQQPYQQGQYPQQPYPQGQYGQQPGQYPPGRYGQQPGQYPPGQYPPPPKKSRKGLFIALGVVAVVILAAVAAFAVFAVKSADENALDVGDCLFFESASTTAADTSHEKRDCSDSEATYEVAQKNDGDVQCAEDYFSYTLVGEDKDVQTTLCLVPNMIEGSCYLLEDDGRIVPSDCADAQTVKVVRRADGENDETLCNEFDTAFPIAFSEPERTYCIEVNLGG
ncbi:MULTISPECIES: LppU/SCO3897 family protein [Rhodococcus]|uniref:Uncharacterized protein n=1 Tax=Rhodococcus opacus RKJ300 = JCM 13270 TaxID=1165867 RepID=I0WAR5_RHOOP|nr:MULTISPECIES: hypothetical protein [Rhodococcus]EID73481.1 hypothetical protein W59_35328 [Rhodococcus opacus RKJ300 = JCM 13270]QQZ12958.1 hypothetical protein GO592_24830 [Rhodococcus sp. 21391]